MKPPDPTPALDPTPSYPRQVPPVAAPRTGPAGLPPSTAGAPAPATAPAGPPQPAPWRAGAVRHGVLIEAAPDDKVALAQQICDVMRLMYEHEYIVAGDGNVSARLPDGGLLITASGVPKGFLAADQIIECDADGNALDERKVTTEVKMHVAAYRERPDIRAVVHGHPLYSVAFSIAGVSLSECLIPEIIVTMGTIPTAPYATPSTAQLPDALRSYLAQGDAVIMERHGVVCVGNGPLDAYQKLEMVEHTAKITWAARALGGKIQPLPPAEVQRLLETRKELGIYSKNNLCDGCGAREVCAAPIFPD